MLNPSLTARQASYRAGVSVATNWETLAVNHFGGRHCTHQRGPRGNRVQEFCTFPLQARQRLSAIQQMDLGVRDYLPERESNLQGESVSGVRGVSARDESRDELDCPKLSICGRYCSVLRKCYLAEINSHYFAPAFSLNCLITTLIFSASAAFGCAFRNSSNSSAASA